MEVGVAPSINFDGGAFSVEEVVAVEIDEQSWRGEEMIVFYGTWTNESEKRDAFLVIMKRFMRSITWSIYDAEGGEVLAQGKASF